MEIFGERLDQTLTNFKDLTELQFSEFFPKVSSAVNPKKYIRNLPKLPK